MPTGQAGDERAVSLKKHAGVDVANWDLQDAAAPGAGDMVTVTAPVLPWRETALLEDESAGAEHSQGATQNGGRKTEIEIPSYLHYQATAELLALAMVMGDSGGAPTTPGGGTLTRDQSYELSLNVNGLVATIGEGPTASHVADQPSALVCPAAMGKGFSIKGQDDGLITLGTQWCGIDVFQNPAPDDDPLPDGLTLNTTMAAIAAATCLSTGARLRMGDLKAFLDIASGSDDFAGGDGDDYVIPLGSFEIGAQRKWSYPDYGSQPANAYDGECRPLMPINAEQQWDPTLAFMLKRYADDDLIGKVQARTPMRMRLEWTGPNIEGSLNYRFRIDLPKVILKTVTLSKGKGNRTRSFTGTIYQAPSTPVGFSSAAKIRISTRNKVTTDLLA